MHNRTRVILTNIGLCEVELEHVEREFLHQVQDRPAGFGLIGTAGVGKTIHLARRLFLAVQDCVEDSGRLARTTVPHRFARWRNWVETAETLKFWISHDFSDDVAELVEQLSECRELYLDDVGQERIVGPDDYALGLLRSILDARYRAKLPVFWTSNLEIRDLNKIYGTRTISRLVSAWPPIPLKGPDLRLARRAS
jgi:DNA replication protein DnaC